MADFVTPAGVRVTLAVTSGHQIRIVTRPGDPAIRVTCRCQESRDRPWAPLAGESDAEMWRAYNRLPHDPADGPFTPAAVPDETEVPHHVAHLRHE